MAAAWKLFDSTEPLQGVLAVGALMVVVLVVLQSVLLAPPWRGRIVGPLVLLALAFVVAVTARLTVGHPELSETLYYTALLMELLAVGRCGFALVFHGLLHWLHRDVPKIFLDIIQAAIYIAALLIVLAVAGAEALPVLTGSAVLSVVLGLSLKDTLGNLFAGLAIQAQRPFEVGDWVQFDNNPAHIGKVIEINWRATTVVTLDDVEVIVPNGMLGTGHIVNFTKPQPASRRSVYVHAAYDVPPQRVHRIILAAMAEAWGVLADPPPSVVTNAFDERGVQYWVRFWTEAFGRRDKVDGGVRDCIWYALHRAGVAVPGPLRTVTLRRALPDDAARPPEDRVAQREQALRGLDPFGVLAADDLRRLALLSQTRLYAPQEVIVRQGEVGEEFFVLMKGRVTVSAERPGGNDVPLSVLGPGEFFGEISLVTGARRTATVQAEEECELLVIGATAFRQALEASRDLAERVRETVARRQAHRDDRLGAVATESKPSDTAVNPLLRLFQSLLGERSERDSKAAPGG